jgi:hypothetical protein
MPTEKPPLDILLGALSVVALPLMQGDASEEMIETAQFYGYEDFGDHFKNVSPRITELTATRPTAERRACVIEIATPRFLLPGAFARAIGRWTKMTKMERVGPNIWRGQGFQLAFEPIRRDDGKTAARLTCTRL